MTDKLESTLKRNVKRIVGIAGLALLGTVAMKDNVHFGSTTINNPQGTHYVIGFMPTTILTGNGEGNVLTAGVLGAMADVNTQQYNGDVSTYGFHAVNLLRGANFDGNVGAYGGRFGWNALEKNSAFNGSSKVTGLASLDITMTPYEESAAFGSHKTLGLTNYKSSKPIKEIIL